jgi:hypothetical protein
VIYAQFHPRPGNVPVVRPIEEFPSVEVAHRVLRRRAVEKEGVLFEQGVPKLTRDEHRRRETWPDATGAALMLVWKRGAADGAPQPSEKPDQIYRLRPAEGPNARHPFVVYVQDY